MPCLPFFRLCHFDAIDTSMLLNISVNFTSVDFTSSEGNRGGWGGVHPGLVAHSSTYSQAHQWLHRVQIEETVLPPSAIEGRNAPVSMKA